MRIWKYQSFMTTVKLIRDTSKVRIGHLCLHYCQFWSSSRSNPMSSPENRSFCLQYCQPHIYLSSSNDNITKLGTHTKLHMCICTEDWWLYTRSSMLIQGQLCDCDVWFLPITVSFITSPFIIMHSQTL
jgi:hypothetical protein